MSTYLVRFAVATATVLGVECIGAENKEEKDYAAPVLKDGVLTIEVSAEGWTKASSKAVKIGNKFLSPAKVKEAGVEMGTILETVGATFAAAGFGALPRATLLFQVQTALISKHSPDDVAKAFEAWLKSDAGFANVRGMQRGGMRWISKEADKAEAATAETSEEPSTDDES